MHAHTEFKHIIIIIISLKTFFFFYHMFRRKLSINCETLKFHFGEGRGLGVTGRRYMRANKHFYLEI